MNSYLDQCIMGLLLQTCVIPPLSPIHKLTQSAPLTEKGYKKRLYSAHIASPLIRPYITSMVVTQDGGRLVCQSHFASNNFPPAFWDELSKVWFTPRALRELDRRNNADKAKRKKDDSNKKVVKKKHQTAHRAQKITTRLLTQFAKDGGPDLANLRGV